ncbi:MAG: general secretion pathway protein, partial [Sphingomonadales bacterium]|nr:general secretion pathway protein [Sphingomonadales bacterium]
YEVSGGVPRRINQICNRLMMLGAVEQRSRIDGAMLSQVLDELELDGTLQLKKPERKPEPLAEVAEAVALPIPVDSVAIDQVHTLLAERDAQIAELQQAVIELANEREAAPLTRPDEGTDHTAAMDALEVKFAALEAKMLEQERTIRHTLTMLIEWIEADDADRAAA